MSIITKKCFTKLIIAIVVSNMYNADSGRFPPQDPKQDVLRNISNEMPTAYCLIHIEKGKKFVLKEKEPNKSDYHLLSSTEWFKDRLTPINIITRADEIMSSSEFDKYVEQTKKEFAAQNKKAKRTLKSKDFKQDIEKDAPLNTVRYIKNDDTIYKPEYTVSNDSASTGDISKGYGIVADCYMINDNQEVKRQVRTLFCKNDSKLFAIDNNRVVKKGYFSWYNTEWVRELAGIHLEDFDKGGDRFYIGPLSPFYDGFIDNGLESKCTLRIKSSSYLATVVFALGLLLAFCL